MNSIVLLFSALTFWAGIAILIRPEPIYRFLGRYSGSLGAYAAAIALRLLLGAAILSCSAQSKFPRTLTVIGWMSIVAAIIFVVIGRQRFKAIIDWAVHIAPRYHHLGGLVAMLFGGFLFYAVLQP